MIRVAVLTWLVTSVWAEPAPGAIDPSFNAGEIGHAADALVVQEDGKVVVGGRFGANSGFAVARLNADGSWDSTFAQVSIDGDFQSAVNAITLQADRKILVGGQFDGINGISRPAIARIETNGLLDSSFAVSGSVVTDSDVVNDIVVQPDGRILLAGRLGRSPIARLHPEGSQDGSFRFAVPNVGASNWGDDLALLPDGRMLLTSRFGLVRIFSDGTLDINFTPAIADPYVLIPQPDSTVVVGGGFARRYGSQRNYLARLRADGSLDPTFNFGPGPDGNVYALAEEANGKIWIGGLFTEVNGSPRVGVARLNRNGTLDEDALPDLQHNPSSLVAVGNSVFVDGIKLVGGDPENRAPNIISQPSDQMVKSGNNAVFSVKASGFPLAYQWKKASGEIPGATNATLVIYNVTAEDSESYTVDVSAAGSLITSGSAVLTVEPAIEGANLIVNPSFELVPANLPEPGSFGFSGVLVPYNYLGVQYPFQGTNYGGLRYSILGTNVWTKPLTGTLDPATIAGQRYLVSIALAAADLVPNPGSRPLDTKRSAAVEILLSDGQGHLLLLGRSIVSDTNSWVTFEKTIVTGRSYNSIIMRGYPERALPLGESFFYVDNASVVALPDASPSLVPIAQQQVKATEMLRVQTEIAGLDVTDDELFFTLEAGAPAGASINAATGEFIWAPPIRYSSSTNYVTVRASYRDRPAITSKQTFEIIVAESLEIGVGESIAVAGKTNTVPITLTFHAGPGATVTNLNFVLVHPPGLTSFSITPLINDVNAALDTESSTETRLTFHAVPEGVLGGSNPFAELRFTSSPGMTRLIDWQIRDAAGTKSDGTAVGKILGAPARSVVVGVEPALEAVSRANCEFMANRVARFNWRSPPNSAPLLHGFRRGR